MRPIGLYLHFPYCWSKCHYCAFNSIRYDREQSRGLLRALAAELGRYAPLAAGRRVATVFLGGGTPSIFGADEILDVLAAARSGFDVAADAEITLEANPGTVRADKLRQLRAGGVNRLSLGVQSFWDDELRYLGRAHSAATAGAAFDAARGAGFDNINLDFIYGFAGHSAARWRATLARALALGPEHLSAYALTIEDGTAFGTAVATGAMVAPDEDEQQRLWQWHRDFLGDHGFNPYEISNFARPGRACRHNLGYWSQEEYIGVGPGAHSYFDRRRFANITDIARYVDTALAGENTVAEDEAVPSELALREAVILGLRMERGIHLDELARRFNRPLPVGIVQRLERLAQDRLAIFNPPRVRLSPAGLALCDGIAVELLAA